MTSPKLLTVIIGKKMKNDIHQHVKACEKCLVTHVYPKISKEAPTLNSIPALGKVWSRSGLKHKAVINNYIVASTDHFSKWVEATAVPDKNAKSVVIFFVILYLPP